MPVSSSNPNSILWPEKYAQDSNIPKTFSNLNLFYCHMIFFFKQWLRLISQFPFISQLIMLYDLTFLLFYLSKELDELPTAKFTDFSALILLDCNNTFLKYASPLASVIHWFLGFLPSPVFLIPFAGVSSVTCCLSFSLCSSSHSVFFLSQLLYINDQQVHTIPTSYLYSLPEISSISIAVATNNFPQLSSELEILINCLWTFLPGLRYLKFTYFPNENTSPPLQPAYLLMFPISINAIILPSLLFWKPGVILNFFLTVTCNLPQSPVNPASEISHTSICIATQSSFLKMKHNLMCHFINVDNFYDIMLPTGQSLKSLVWQTRFFRTCS